MKKRPLPRRIPPVMIYYFAEWLIGIRARKGALRTWKAALKLPRSADADNNHSDTAVDMTPPHVRGTTEPRSSCFSFRPSEGLKALLSKCIAVACYWPGHAAVRSLGGLG